MAASSTCTRNPILLRPNLLIPPHNTNNILKMKNNTPPMISHPLKMIPRCSSVAGGDVFSVTSSSKHDVDYLGQSTKGDLRLNSGSPSLPPSHPPSLFSQLQWCLMGLCLGFIICLGIHLWFILLIWILGSTSLLLVTNWLPLLLYVP